jgi:hypothetical protein
MAGALAAGLSRNQVDPEPFRKILGDSSRTPHRFFPSQWANDAKWTSALGRTRSPAHLEREDVMKRVLVVALVLMATVWSIAFAAPNSVRVNIPFAFHAGDATLPAGEYMINYFLSSNLILRNMEGVDTVFVPMICASRLRNVPQYSVSFNRYGDQYFLAAMDNGDFKVTFPKNKLQRKLAGEDLQGTVIAYLLR